MSTIDRRVVEMRFDNKQFESGVATTMSTLDKFKQSLNLTGATKGLENVSSAARRCDISALGTAVETVRTKFSALEVMGITALANITNSAVNAGKRMVSALTIDPIKTGFQEYETQINAVQTILANTQSKGTTINDVNDALDTLNTYADKTIYNFTEMTRNIGTFTAAGVDLDTSVSAIQGIANLAAVSGSNSQQASTAMYQLSQALAAGTVKLMDWNSVVNAGMGGQVFQDALKKTSEELGTGAEAAIKANGSFRESLQTGWLTSEVLTETLKKFTTSGANEYIAEYTGLSEEAVSSALKEAEARYGEADAIDKAAEALANKSGKNKDEIKEALLFAKTAEDAATKVKTLSQLWDTLKEAVQSGWTQTWEIIVGDFEEAKELLTKVSDTLNEIIGNSAKARNDLLQGWKDAGGRKYLIEGLKNAFEAMMNVIKPIKEAFREIFPPMTVKNLTDFTAGFKNLTARFKEFTAGHADQVKSIFKGIFSVLDMGLSVVKAAASGIAKLFGFFIGYSGSILDAAAALGDWLTNLRESAKETNIFGTAIEKVKGFLDDIIDGFKNFGKAFKEFCTPSGYEGFLGFFQTLWEMISQLGAGAVKVFSAISKGLSEAFSNVDFNNLINLFNGGLLAGILLTVKKFVGGVSDAFDTGAGALKNIKGILDDVRGCLQAYQEQLKAGALLKIASAIGILAASLFVISTIDDDSLKSSLVAVTVLFGELMGALSLFSEISGNGMQGVVKSVAIMTSMSAAILILSFALKTLSTVDVAGLAIGLAGVGGLMLELSIFMQTAEFDGKMAKTATGIAILATAMLILASAVHKFGELDSGTLVKGLLGVGAILAELAIFTNLTGNASHVLATGTSMILLGAALKILASAVSDFGAMQWDEIVRGLVAMAGALAAVTIAMNLMPENMISTGIGLIAVSGAMMILANAMSSFGGMSLEEIGKGLAAIGGALLELSIALNLMNGTLAGSAALIIAAGALAIIAPVMQQLGQMTWAEIGMGLVTLAAAFGAIGIAGLLLTPVIPALLGLGAAFALIGVASVGLGAGLGLIATGFAALAAACATGATAIVAALTIIVTGLINLIPAVCIQIANGIVAFAQALAAGVPVIMQTIGIMLDGFLTLIVSYVPRLVDAGMKLLIGLLQGIANNIQKVVEIAVDIVVNFVNGIANSIPKIIQSGVDLMLSFINGMADSIRQNTSRVIAATDNLMNAIIGAIKAYFTHFMSKGRDLVKYMVDGVKSKMSDFKGAAKNMMDGFIRGVKEKFTDIKNAAVNAIEGAVDGVKAFLGIASPSKEFAKIGNWSMEGFAEGITANMSAEEAAKKKAQNIVSIFKEELDKLDLDKKTIDLEYELAVANGETVDTVDKTSKEFDIQAQRVQLASEEYEITMYEFGETAEETQEAYNKLLEEKIKMSKLSSELSSIQKAEFKNNRDALDEYIAWMESSDKLLDMGFSEKEIDDAGRSATGYTGALFYDFGDDSARAGESIAEGMADGIEFGKRMTVSAAENLAVATLGIVNSVLGIHSPSKEFAKVGRWSVEGMAVGLAQYSKIVEASAENVGKNALNSISDVVSGISTVFDSDLDVQPEIRPVIDLSNIQNGVGMIDGMFAQRSLALAGINADLSGTSLNINGAIDRMQKLNDYSNAKVVDAISSLREDFGSLINAIGGMHIRMDSGTVVGELIGKIDTGLGRISNYKGRGI